VRALANVLHRVRFRLWITRLRVKIRRAGGRLIVEAPGGIRMKSPPILHVTAEGDGEGTLTLRIGSNVTFGQGISMRIRAKGTNLLELGDNTDVQDGVRIWLYSGTLSVARNCILRDLSLYKTSGLLELGEFSRAGYGTAFHCDTAIKIGARVGIADHIFFIDSDHVHDGSDTWMMDQPIKVAPIEIGRNVLIGSNAVITRGARVGKNSIIAASALVRSGDYPESSLIGGMPATALRSLRDS
jgi:acetyltransferase-like isoleucine patch superfamily enzyme